ncbi:MAG: Dna2/Cas4 domain-containing protein, partial [Eubacterium callanderi]
VLKDKGIERRGKIEFIEKKKAERKIYYEDLTQEREKELEEIIRAIETLLETPFPPERETGKKCRQCAYFDYCVL